MSNANYTQVENTVLSLNNLRTLESSLNAAPGILTLGASPGYLAAADVDVVGANVALTQSQLLKAVQSPSGLLVDALGITAAVELIIPDFAGVTADTNAHAQELLSLLGLNSIGDQVVLKFTRWGTAANGAFALGLENSAGTGVNVQFSSLEGAAGAAGTLFAASATASHALVVATNITAPGTTSYQIRFTTVQGAAA